MKSPRIHGCRYDRNIGRIVVTVDRELQSRKLDMAVVAPRDAVRLIGQLADAVLAHNDDHARRRLSDDS